MHTALLQRMSVVEVCVGHAEVIHQTTVCRPGGIGDSGSSRVEFGSCPFTCCQFSVTQLTRPCIGRNRLRLRVVSSYSTRRGTSGNNSLVSNPSLSRFRSVSVSILCEMPGIALSSSENRARPPPAVSPKRGSKRYSTYLPLWSAARGRQLGLHGRRQTQNLVVSWGCLFSYLLPCELRSSKCLIVDNKLSK